MENENENKFEEEYKENNDICPCCGKNKNETGFIKKRRSCRLCINKKMQEYKRQNKEKISEYNKKYKNDHVDDIKEYNANYNIKNRKTIQKRHTAYLREKRKNDPQYKLGTTIRNRLNKVLNGQKKKSTLESLGCSYKFLKEWIEFQFDDTMTFKNHGTVWHIDHIIPCASFDLENEDEMAKCCNWTNLKPMISKNNMAKKGVIPQELVDNEKNVKDFLKTTKLKEIPKIIEFDKKEYIGK